MAALKTAVADQLSATVADIFNVTGVVLTGQQAEYLASGMPESLWGQLEQAAARQACRKYADQPEVGGDFFTTQAERVCRPYLDSIGYGSGPSLTVPFEGGQCPVRYRLRTETRRFNNNTQSWEWNPGNIFEFNGPLQVTNEPVAGVCPAGTVGPQGWILRSPNETQPRSLSTGCFDISPSYRFILIERVDGQPDDCGDPPPDFSPPTPPPVPSPPTERFNPGPGTDVNIGVEIGPDGTISVDFGGGPSDSPVGPQPTAPASPGGARPGSPDGVGDPIDGSGSGGGAGPDGGEDVPFGPPPDGRVWVGALVEAIAPPALGNIAGSGPANTAYPRVVGNCSLIYAGGRGRAQRIESRWTDLGRPADGLQVTGCRVNVLPGVSFRVFPLSDETCPESTCE